MAILVLAAAFAFSFGDSVRVSFASSASEAYAAVVAAAHPFTATDTLVKTGVVGASTATNGARQMIDTTREPGKEVLYSQMSQGTASTATAPTALIYGPSVSGSPSQEEQTATAQGFTVTVVSDATWQSMTQAQFAAYDLLIIGDPSCGGTPNAVANSSVWAPVVMGTAGGRTLAGNRILIGTDPALHDGGVNTTQGTIIRTGIGFAGKQTGRTGLYFDASCSGGGGAVLTTLSSLSTGSGTWINNTSPPCGGSVAMIASEPSFTTLTSASLQGWGCSVHETWPTFASDWSGLAIATDTATHPTCGVDKDTGLNACGEAYILIAGSSVVVTSGSISMAPLDATNPVGGSHTVTAHVTNGGSPVVGREVCSK